MLDLTQPDESAKLGQAVSLLISWGRQRRTRLAQPQEQADDALTIKAASEAPEPDKQQPDSQ